MKLLSLFLLLLIGFSNHAQSLIPEGRDSIYLGLNPMFKQKFVETDTAHFKKYFKPVGEYIMLRIGGYAKQQKWRCTGGMKIPRSKSAWHVKGDTLMLTLEGSLNKFLMIDDNDAWFVGVLVKECFLPPSHSGHSPC